MNTQKVDPRIAARAFMGEEKPDEELMGKRKSSPRLSPTPLGAGTIIVTRAVENIRTLGKNNANHSAGDPSGNIDLLQNGGLW